MAIGKQSISLRKKSVSDSKIPTVGVKTLSFAHEASLNDNVIPFDNLNEPVSWQNSGRSNPSTQDIQQANLYTFRNNIHLSSSLKGYIQPTEYRVSNNRITFLTFFADASEVFIVSVSDIVVNGNTIVDSRPIAFDGVLAEANTDVIVGDSWEVGADPKRVLVFRGGELQSRNTDNSSVTLDGDYYELSIPGTNLSNTIRFNTPGGVGGEKVSVISAIGYAEKPQLSILQSLESLAGQVDAMIPDLALETGNPETKYQNAPNNIDLRKFGQDVFNLKTTLGIVVGPSGSGDYASIQDAINASTSGDKITLLPGTYTENIIVDKKIFFEGQGHITLLDGTVNLNAGSDRSMFKFLKFNGNVTGAVGVKELIITDCWIAAGSTVTVDNPLENIVTVMQES